MGTDQSLAPLAGCNYIESLSGIETFRRHRLQSVVSQGCNYIESLSGIETSWNDFGSGRTYLGCNYIESLSGIETESNIAPFAQYCCNYIESLSGIETIAEFFVRSLIIVATI